MSNKIKDRFIRSLTATKENCPDLSITAQPYLTGMYVVIDGTQCGFSHKQYPKKINNIKKMLENDGYEVKTIESNILNFIDINLL